LSSPAPARSKVHPLTLLHGLGPLLGLAVLCAILGVLSDRFFTLDNLVNVLRQSSVNALLSLGQLVVIITAGIDLSAGSILGLSCVISAMLLKWGAPPAVSLMGALAIGAALGAANGVLFTKLRLPHPFIPTLGMMNVARGVALVITGGFPVSELSPAFRFWGAGAVSGIPVSVIVVAFFCGLIHIFLTRTTAGRDVYAIGGNALAARLSGVPVDSRLILVYALSGLMAGAGAIVLAGRMNSGFPLAGVGAELDAIAAVIIGGASFFGGAGTVGGTLLGAIIMGVLRNGLNLMNVNAYWQTIVIGGVIVVAVWVDAVRKRAAERSAR
jgi:ribose transport system permease protein